MHLELDELIEIPVSLLQWLLRDIFTPAGVLFYPNLQIMDCKIFRFERK